MCENDRRKADEFRKEVSNWNLVSEVSDDMVGVPPTFRTHFPHGIGGEEIQKIRDAGFHIDIICAEGSGVDVWIELDK